MKRIAVIIAISAFLTSCQSGNSKNNGSDNMNAGSASAGDSLKRASDSVMQTGDTSALNQPLGDSTSASGDHGQGSGSRLGGGKTGQPQNKKP